MSIVEAVGQVVGKETLHDNTAAMAIDKVCEDLKLTKDPKSRDKQAYILHTMVSHLRRVGREGRTSTSCAKLVKSALRIPRMPPRVLKRPATAKTPKSKKLAPGAHKKKVNALQGKTRRLRQKQPQPVMYPNEQVPLAFPEAPKSPDPVLDAAEIILACAAKGPGILTQKPKKAELNLGQLPAPFLRGARFSRYSPRATVLTQS